jgi:redox-sensitive bicupin YhaK (pirin superfamily)
MIKYVNHKDVGYFNHGWLDTYHHFSFGDYYDPERMHYGPLRVVNDDIIDGHQGFPKHPHKDMEIISYVVEGGLSHGDSMGHEETVYRGEVQYMSAGTGVYHSEYNHGDDPVRLFQIWVMPDEKGHQPQYGDHRFKWEDRLNKWLHLVGKDAPIKVHQDVNFYVTYLDQGQKINFDLKEDRQVYLIQIEGESLVNDVTLLTRDALEVTEAISISAKTKSHLLALEMKRG